jgi:phage terminase large subunit GpA-like protein
LPVSAHIPTPTEWQTENRYLPAEITDDPGQFDPDDVPHWVEPLNCVHPDNPATHVSIMKSVQSMCTVTVAEGAIGFFIRYKLGSIAYFTSSKTVAKMRGSAAIDVLIDNSNLAHCLKPISDRNARKSADTALYKEFAGGVRLLLSSYGAKGDFKSMTYHLIIPDEWDEAPVDSGGQGDIAGILKGRGQATENFVQLFISTPSPMDTSRIYKNFIEGDQCRYFAPCPHCGTEQYLIFKGKKDRHGLTFSMKKDPETDARVLDTDSVRYICKNEDCVAGIKADEAAREVGKYAGIREHQKMAMLRKGQWVPTWKDTPHKPLSPNHRSFHAPGMLSKLLTWAKICQGFIDTAMGKDVPMLKDFTINVLGEPWARVETKSSWKDFKQRAEDYVLGAEVPEGALILFGAVDVQGDRLECGVWGYGPDFKKYLVDYRVWYGDPADPADSCWAELRAFGYSTPYKIEGCKVGCVHIGVDSGWDPRLKREKDWDSKAHVVYNFVAQNPDRFMALRGAAETATGEVIRTARVKDSSLKTRYDVSTHVVKEMLMMVVDQSDGPNSIHFPKYRQEQGIVNEIPDEFFRQFLSERYQEVAPGKMGWKKIHERNEPFDIGVYCTAIAYYKGVHTWEEHVWEGFRQQLRTTANARG